MDTRQGNIYPTREDALAAGVPEEFVAEVKPEEGEMLRVTSGPFKGRVYQRTATGLRRVRTTKATK